MSVINPKKLNFDKMLYPKDKDFEACYSYERYMGRIKVEEAKQNIDEKELIDHESPVDNVFLVDKVPRKMQVAKENEEFFKKKRKEISTVLRDHLYESKRVKEIYAQFRVIFTNQMQKQVHQFINRPETSLDLMDEYSEQLNELRRFRAMAR